MVVHPCCTQHVLQAATGGVGDFMLGLGGGGVCGEKGSGEDERAGCWVGVAAWQYDSV